MTHRRNMKRIDILYLYEHVARELDVACIVKHYVESRYGLTCEIAHQFHGVADALTEWNPRLIILPFCYTDSIQHYPFLYDWDRAICFNMAWEELLYPGNREAKLPRGKFETRHVIHHAWSENYASLLESCGVPRAHIFVNGNPAYRLYDAPYRDFFTDRETLAAKYGLDARKRWVFFPENYNWAFYKEWRIKAFARDGVNVGTMDDMIDFSRNSFRDAMGWCARLSTNANVEFILRPRPMTPLEEFRQAVETLVPNMPPQLRITKEASVREWILASDVVLSSYSTSLIEAAVAGKRAFLVEPFPVPAALRSDWHTYAPALKSFEAFERACLDDTAQDNRLGDWARETMMARGDSILNLAKYFAGLVSGNIKRPAPWPHRTMLKTHVNRMWATFAFAKERYRGRKKRQTAKPLSAIYEKDVLPQTEIRERTERWAGSLERTREVRG